MDKAGLVILFLLSACKWDDGPTRVDTDHAPTRGSSEEALEKCGNICPSDTDTGIMQAYGLGKEYWVCVCNRPRWWRHLTP